VRSPELEQTILGAFRHTVPRDRYPVCFVHLQVHPNQIDWNRHPAKAEVYLHHIDLWRTQISKAIEQALNLNPQSLPDTAYSQRVHQVLKTAESSGTYQSSSSTSADRPISPTPPFYLRALAQVHGMYILAEHPSGMWLVEQHIAHERVIYEQLCDRWQVVQIERPILLSPLSSAQVEQLRRLNLEVEAFGEGLWAVRTVPEALAHRDDCSDALLELSLGGDLDTALVATACRTAIRNGTPMTLTEMQTLLDQWRRTRNLRTCPHGRPIYLSLEESSLSRFFRRHWVIGKSHGI
jgi:DNA mismatch repair protein MutL